MTNPSGLDALETLARRRPVLAALESGARSKRELVDRLGAARSTVDRAVRELELLGFVEREDGRYRLTLPGRLALSEHDDSAGTLSDVVEVADLLSHLPRDAPMSVRMLDGATIHVPEPSAPYESFESLVGHLETADRFRGVSAADRFPRLRNLLYERTIEGELDAEAIFTDELVAFLCESYPELLREVIERGDFGVYSIPSVPYGLGLVESETCSRAFVVVYGESAEARGIVENGSPAALEWADETYRRFRADAAPIELSE